MKYRRNQIFKNVYSPGRPSFKRRSLPVSDNVPLEDIQPQVVQDEIIPIENEEQIVFNDDTPIDDENSIVVDELIEKEPVVADNIRYLGVPNHRVVKIDGVIVEDNVSITIQHPRDNIMQTEQQTKAVAQEQLRSPREMMDSIINMLYAKIDNQMYQQLVQLEQSLRGPEVKPPGAVDDLTKK